MWKFTLLLGSSLWAVSAAGPRSLPLGLRGLRLLGLLDLGADGLPLGPRGEVDRLLARQVRRSGVAGERGVLDEAYVVHGLVRGVRHYAQRLGGPLRVVQGAHVVDPEGEQSRVLVRLVGLSLIALPPGGRGAQVAARLLRELLHAGRGP